MEKIKKGEGNEEVERIEKLIDNLNSNTKTLNEELRSFKNYSNQKTNNKKENENKWDLINTRNNKVNNNESRSLLKVKSFNDLQLDLNLLNNNSNNKAEEENDSIKKKINEPNDVANMAFLNNIIKSAKEKKEQKKQTNNKVNFIYNFRLIQILRTLFYY